MRKALNLEQLYLQLRVLLQSRGPLTAAEAFQALGISQPSFSRLTEAFKTQLLVMGRGKNSVYGLRKPGNGYSVPELWQRAQTHPLISARFKTIAAENERILAQVATSGESLLG